MFNKHPDGRTQPGDSFAPGSGATDERAESIDLPLRAQPGYASFMRVKTTQASEAGAPLFSSLFGLSRVPPQHLTQQAAPPMWRLRAEKQRLP